MWRLLARLWNSPTFTTWGNLGIRMLGMAVLLPLVLSRLPVEEVNVWLLLQSIVMLQGMVEFGFGPTFTRFVAYAGVPGTSTRPEEPESRPATTIAGEMTAVVSTMRFVYRRLGMISALLLATVGTAAMAVPISQLPAPWIGWACWMITAVSGVIALTGGMYSAYLHGINKIALNQRCQFLVSLPTLLLAVVVVFVSESLIALVAVMQAGVIAKILVAAALARRHSQEDCWRLEAQKDEAVMRHAWPAAWRSGIGVMMTFGAIHGAGIVYAQVARPQEAAAFLLAQRLLQTLSTFCNAPFYTRIPAMARAYADQRTSDITGHARSGMAAANWLMVVGIVLLGFGADPILVLIGSDTPFVPPAVWWLLGLATLTERIGAMHLQLYSVTNIIRWHIANGVAGAIMLASMPVLYHFLGVLGLPLGFLMGYGLFYVPYSIAHSYKEFYLKPIAQDAVPTILPAATLIGIFGLELFYFH